MSEATIGGLAEAGVLEVNDGYRTKRSELGNPGVPILRVSEVLNGRISPTFGDHIREEFRPMFRRKASMPGDVVLTTKGTVGRVARIAAGVPEFVYSPQVCFFRVHDLDVLDAGWLYQWLRGPEFRRQVHTVQDQTDMAAYINLVDLRAIAVHVPPLAEQRAIADVLGALDDKIEANRRVAASARQLIDALFNQMTAHDSGREVPLMDIVNFVFGEPFDSSFFNTARSGRPLIRIRDLKTFSPLFFTTEERDRETVVRPGDVVVGMDAEFRPTIWCGEPGLLNQRVCLAKPLTGSRALVFKLLQAPLAHIESFKTGTTVSHLNKADLEQGTVTLPTANDLGVFDCGAEPLSLMILALHHESRSLEELRNALLPKLLSGEVRVRDVDSLVGEGV